MKTTKIYRADDYNQNTGYLIGFFLSKEDAESRIKYSNPTDVGDGNFSEITEFEVESSKLEGVELKDHATMLSEEVWGDSEIIIDYYYK